MRIRGVLVAVLCFIALLAMSARLAVAQSVTCSSDDGRRHYCGIDTRGGVSMVRQRSDARCQQGYSWGYDRRGVWVDHGCRADFVASRGNGYGPGGVNGRPGWNNGRGGQSLTCSSDDGRRHYCTANTRGNVQMVRQRSDARCQQGYSWGYDRRGVWVDHGCRADFLVR